MKIERINENQIRCTLSSSDLSSRDMNIRELAYGTEKARALFREMIQKASNELGFDAEDIPLMVEAIPLPNESIMLVITKIEDPEELDTRFSKFAPMAYDNSDCWSDLASEILEGADGLAKFLGNLGLTPVTEGTDDSENAQSEDNFEQAKGVSIRVYSFDSLDQVSEAARACADLYSGESTLYKKPDTFRYFLVIKDDGSDSVAFSRVCNILAEYGTKTHHEYASEAYYTEHYTIVCKDHALQIMASI